MKFSIWAPRAQKISLCIFGDRRPMIDVGRGDWEIEVPEPLPAGGVAYRYAIDDGPPLPDPASRWQPDGPHGDSWRLPEPAPAAPEKFQARELSEAVLYELHVGTFTPEGTYRAAQEKLPHLAALGVTHLELMPLATFPGAHGWGYDGVAWFAPHPAYGTPGELREFVRACHRHGLAVLLDVVYNHLGPDGNFLPQFAPCFGPGKTLWGEALNYDGPHSDGLRRFIFDNATSWLRDYGFDGLRLDAVHAIVDTRALHVLEELMEHVRQLERALGRRLVVIAESDLHDPKLVRPPPAGYGLDAFWADDFHHAVHRFFTGESHGYYADFGGGLRDIVRALRDGYVYQGQYSVSRQRSHGRAPIGVGPSQLVFCIQNHDQIGNRARGERLAALLPATALKAAAALLLLAPQVPLLFQGEEWGASTPFLYFTDHQDPALGRAVTEGRRREFPLGDTVPDPQDPATFRASQLRWDEPAQPGHADVLAWYRRLIALRREIGNAAAAIAFHEEANWLTLQRGPLLAVFNFADEPQAIPLPSGERRVELSSRSPLPADSTIPGRTTVVFRRRE